MSDPNATDQGITQQMGEHISPERKARQTRIHGVKLVLASYRRSDRPAPVRTTLDTEAVAAMLDELKDLEAERDAGQHGWDEAARQFRALQQESAATIRELRRRLTQLRENAEGAERTDKGRIQELNDALTRYMRDLLALQQENHRLRNAKASDGFTQGGQSFEDHMRQWGPPFGPQTHEEMRANLHGVNRDDLSPEVQQMIDEMTGGRPWDLAGPPREVIPGLYVASVDESIGCSDPEVMGVEQLAQHWETTPALVRSFLNLIEWPHNCEHHGHQVQQHEAAELKLCFVAWRNSTPFGGPAEQTTGELISGDDILARDEPMRIQLVELMGRPIFELGPEVMRDLPSLPGHDLLGSNGIEWHPRNRPAVLAMSIMASLGARFRRVG